MADIVPANSSVGLPVSPIGGISSSVSVGADHVAVDQFQRLLDTATLEHARSPQLPAADANARARRALDLDSKGRVSPSGDVILGGLQKIRGAFDQQQAKLNGAISANSADPKMLYAAQMEIMNYSVLIDLTSKLTGKSTQAFETLLKG